MKKRLLLTAIATMLVASLLTGCGNTAQTDLESTETVENDVSKTNSQEADKPHEHNYVEEVTKEVTCTEAGEKTFTCECGDSYIEEIEATGHNYVEVADSAKNATCTDNGKEVDTKCSLCGDVVNGAIITATGHSYGDYVYNNDATYEKDGTETATCSICGNKDTRTKAGTKLVKEEPECPYELGVWYDMGWYFFKLSPAESGFNKDGDMEKCILLMERYPEYQVNGGGWYSKWGYGVYVVFTYPLQGNYVFN